MNGFCIASEQFGTHFLVYLYDESGAPIGLQYRNKSDAKNVFYTYYFEKNLQGDIIAIYTEICSTRLIDGDNPSVIPWDAPQVNTFLLYNFGIVKEIGYVPNYYDSRTVYFAVSK